MLHNFDEIELKIIALLEKFVLDAKQTKLIGDRNWTIQIKQRIGLLGHELGFKTSIGGFPEQFEPEWLFDVVWYIENSNGQLLNVPLVVESEWDKKYGGIKYDFEKLLLANAERRLMICQAKESYQINLIENLQNAVNVYKHNTGNRYLIAILNCDTDDKFTFHLIVKS